MTILDALLSGVGVVGNVLDTPGAIVRNTFSGRDPFSGLNPFDAEGRASGRDMLESWGWLGQNEEGLDWGDAAGFGAELLTDPLNLIGGGVAKNTSLLAKEAKAANALTDARHAAGWMPADVARATSVVDEAGLPRRMYHGTPHQFDAIDPAKFQDGLHGRGYYMTSNPEVATDYAYPKSAYFNGLDDMVEAGYSPNIRTQYADIRNPLQMDSPMLRVEAEEMARRARQAVPDMAEDASFLADDAADSGGPMLSLGDEGDAASTVRVRPNPSPFVSPDSFRRSLIDYTRRAADNGQDSVVERLKALGYDGIQETGGTRMGGGNLHDVLIAFDPEQVYKPWVADDYRAIPSQLPLLGALLGHHALARGSQF